MPHDGMANPPIMDFLVAATHNAETCRVLTAPTRRYRDSLQEECTPLISASATSQSSRVYPSVNPRFSAR